MAEFDIMFVGPRRGISLEGDIVDLGVEHNVIEKSGAFYTYRGTRLGQGRENAKLFLIEHEELAAEMEAAIRVAVGLPVVVRPASMGPVETMPAKAVATGTDGPSATNEAPNNAASKPAEEPVTRINSHRKASPGRR